MNTKILAFAALVTALCITGQSSAEELTVRQCRNLIKTVERSLRVLETKSKLADKKYSRAEDACDRVRDSNERTIDRLQSKIGDQEAKTAQAESEANSNHCSTIETLLFGCKEPSRYRSRLKKARAKLDSLRRQLESKTAYAAKKEARYCTDKISTARQKAVDAQAAATAKQQEVDATHARCDTVVDC